MDTMHASSPDRRSFFVALPDTPEAAGIAARLQVPTALVHPSGRPWILADPSTDDIVSGTSGSTSVVLVGHSTARAEELRRAAQNARSATDLVSQQARHAGSYVTIGTHEGRVVASGQAMETRRLWSARIDGLTVISDRADVLAELGGFRIDPASLALRLISSIPHPLDRVGVWREVEPLPGDEYIVVDRDGERLTGGTWWRLPDDDVSRQDGAEPFRAAVEDAVRARTLGGHDTACDLSGGLDSTPLCHYAAQGPTGVLARTLFNDDPGGREDLKWARKALATMPGVHTHLVSSTDDFADFYEGIEAVEQLLDEPTQAVTAGPRILAMLSDDAARGIGVHINGFGGDHLLRGVPAWEHGIARSQPLTGWRRARDQHIPEHVSPFATLRQLGDRRSYRRWLRDTFTTALGQGNASRVPGMNDWSSPVMAPPWLTTEGRALVRSLVEEHVADVEPLAASIAGHTDVFFVRDAARLVRGTAQLGQPAGVAYEAPLLDDRVAEAAFQVRRVERDTPLEWKPLMKAAMRGVLPDDYLLRTSKVGGGPQAVRGFGQHYDALVGLMEDGGLFASGLVDRGSLLESTSPSRWEMPPSHIHQAINAAVFLRNQIRSPQTVAA